MGTPCKNGWAVGLGNHKDESPTGGTNEEVEAQNPKSELQTLSMCWPLHVMCDIPIPSCCRNEEANEKAEAWSRETGEGAA